MLKLIYIFEHNDMEFPRNVIEEIKDLTWYNHHGDALIVFAEQMEDDGINLGNLLRELEDINDEHNRLGHLPKDLSDARYEIHEELDKILYENYDNADEVYQAF